MTTIEPEGERFWFAAKYGGELADHLPMALVALEQMGATTHRRAEFARTYIGEKQLRRLDERDPELVERTAMRVRIDEEGRDRVISDEVAQLARGIGAGAFHAFIRLAYGITADDNDEIAAALVYWRDAALDLGASRTLSEREPFDVVRALERVRHMLGDLPTDPRFRGLIATRMEMVARAPVFDQAIGNPTFGEDAVAQCAALTVRAFAATRDFTLLHAMTATHALRLVLPFVADRDALLAFYWRALAAAYVSAGAPSLPHESSFAADRERTPEWRQLIALACASNDEHVVKATYTAWREDAAYRNPLYRLAAARYSRLMSDR